MESTSTLKPTAMIETSHSFSDAVADDGPAPDSQAGGDTFDDDLDAGSFRGFGFGFRYMLTGLKEGLGRAFSRHHDEGAVDELREALAEGRRQVAAERRADRHARREARAQLAWEEREIRDAHRRGLLAQQVDLDDDFAGTLDQSARSDSDLESESVTDRGLRTDPGVGPALRASARWMGIDERPERGCFVAAARASVA